MKDRLRTLKWDYVTESAIRMRPKIHKLNDHISPDLFSQIIFVTDNLNCEISDLCC